MKTKKIQKPFSLDKLGNCAKLETRDGRPVRIICKDAMGDKPIVGLVTEILPENRRVEVAGTWWPNGKWYKCGDSHCDLVLVEITEERWSDDKTADGEGWWINKHSKLKYGPSYNLNVSENFNVFATEKQAKSSLAMARISQLMAHDERYGGVVTDEEWLSSTCAKYALNKQERSIETEIYYLSYHFLAFHTLEQCDLFLKENEQLVKDYLMID